MQLYWLCVLPLVLLGVWLAYNNVQAVRAEQDEQASRLVRNFIVAIDQQLRANINALQIIALSPHLGKPDELSQLYLESKSIKDGVGLDVVLIEVEPSRRMLFSTQVPFGSPLPPTPAAQGFQALPAAVSTRQPAVGDHLISPFTQQPIVAIVVPAVRNGVVTHAIASPIEAQSFQQILDRFTLPAGWSMTLKDRTGYVLARRPPASDPAQGSASEPSDEMDVTSPIAGWTASLEIPASSRIAPIQGTGIALGLLLLAATLSGVFAGIAGGRRLGRAVASLTQGGPAPHLQIVEIQEAQALLDESTERQKVSEARFRRLFQDSPVGMRLTDKHGQILAQNANFEKMFGYSIQEVPTIGVWMDKAYPDPAKRRHVEEAWHEIITSSNQTGSKVFTGEFRITTKDGRERHVVARSSLLTEGPLTTFIDVTEQRQTEASLRLWAEAFEHAQLSLVIADPMTDTIVAANPVFAATRGYTPAEMAGMPVTSLFPEELQEGMRGKMRDSREQVTKESHYSLETEHLRKDGSRFPVLADITVASDADGHPISRLTYTLDLTERKRAEAEIRTLHETLERRVVERTVLLTRANQELDSFAYTVSHDLRAPLRAMDGFLHLLREEHGAQLPKEARLYLEKISGAILRMKDLMEGILTLTHSARQELDRTPVDLSALIKKYLNELQAAEPDRQVHFDVQPDLFVEGDARMLGVVASNLVGNAWKYTSKTPAASIRFFASQRGGQTWFSLVDNGAGFDSAHAHKLFQPFQRMHRHEEFPGIGIGLATVQRVVARHGGQIEAEGRAGQGALFRFTLQPDSCSRPNAS